MSSRVDSNFKSKLSHLLQWNIGQSITKCIKKRVVYAEGWDPRLKEKGPKYNVISMMVNPCDNEWDCVSYEALLYEPHPACIKYFDTSYEFNKTDVFGFEFRDDKNIKLIINKAGNVNGVVFIEHPEHYKLDEFTKDVNKKFEEVEAQLIGRCSQIRGRQYFDYFKLHRIEEASIGNKYFFESAQWRTPPYGRIDKIFELPDGLTFIVIKDSVVGINFDNYNEESLWKCFKDCIAFENIIKTYYAFQMFQLINSTKPMLSTGWLPKDIMTLVQDKLFDLGNK